MRVLVTGGTGQVGRALVRLAPRAHEVIGLGAAECDVADDRAVARAFDGIRPDLVVHAAAMTDVDACEREPERAWQVNALGARGVAGAAAARDVPLVYISTNYVFDGEAPEPYDEDAPTGPLNVYGATKLAGEHAVRDLCPRHLVVRTAMIYDETGKNFVNTMLRLSGTGQPLAVVADQYGNPTYASDLAEALWRLVARPRFGTFHLINAGTASWYEWAVAIFELARQQPEVTPIPAGAFERAAQPPRNGALANRAAAALGVELPDWRDALRRCLARREALSVPS